MRWMILTMTLPFLLGGLLLFLARAPEPEPAADSAAAEAAVIEPLDVAEDVAVQRALEEMIRQDELEDLGEPIEAVADAFEELNLAFGGVFDKSGGAGGDHAAARTAAPELAAALFESLPVTDRGLESVRLRVVGVAGEELRPHLVRVLTRAPFGLDVAAADAGADSSTTPVLTVRSRTERDGPAVRVTLEADLRDGAERVSYWAERATRSVIDEDYLAVATAADDGAATTEAERLLDREGNGLVSAQREQLQAAGGSWLADRSIGFWSTAAALLGALCVASATLIVRRRRSDPEAGDQAANRAAPMRVGRFSGAERRWREGRRRLVQRAHALADRLGRAASGIDAPRGGGGGRAEASPIAGLAGRVRQLARRAENTSVQPSEDDSVCFELFDEVWAAVERLLLRVETGQHRPPKAETQLAFDLVARLEQRIVHRVPTTRRDLEVEHGVGPISSVPQPEL